MCESRSCTEKVCFKAREGEEVDYDMALSKSSLLTNREYNTFVAEASVAAILRCRASAFVIGKPWFD